MDFKSLLQKNLNQKREVVKREPTMRCSVSTADLTVRISDFSGKPSPMKGLTNLLVRERNSTLMKRLNKK